MVNIQDEIEAIQKEIRETPYHKGTEHHIGLLRARLSRLKDKLLEQSFKKGGGGGGYAVKKQGDATVVLIGPPSSGKSTLFNKLTNAKSKVAPYAFTTVSVIPGIMEYKDAQIQILDVPGLIEKAEEGRGRGREVLSVARGADLIILLTDVQRIHAFQSIKKSLEDNGIRLNIVRPKVLIKKKARGGIIIHSNFEQELKKETIIKIAQESGLKNAEIFINEKISTERLIDSFSENRAYLPAIYAINKIDLQPLLKNSNENLSFINGEPVILISAEKGIGISELKEKVWEKIGLVRAYLVERNEKPNFDNPIIMQKGQTLYDITLKLGPKFANTKGAKIWGDGAKFPGQEVSLNTKVLEGMQVKFI